MVNQKAFKGLLRLFVMGLLSAVALSLVEFCRNPGQALSRTRRVLRGEVPALYVSQAEESPQEESGLLTPKQNVKFWDPEFYGPVRFEPREFDYRVLSSLSSHNGSFWPILLGRYPGFNANLIPHPVNRDAWIVVVQREQFYEKFEFSEELACAATFTDGALKCLQDAAELPIERSVFGLCEYSLHFANFRRGPRDARVFYGPEAPYIMYGSQSRYICMGLWMQDIRGMLDQTYFGSQASLDIRAFKRATELRRLNVTGSIEKNYFLFWDGQGRGYVHYNLWPQRSFGELHADGSPGAVDLALASAEHDQRCLKSLMPPVAQEVESIHQATNSLAVTMCRRAEPGCVPTDDNTFIMHIFHHKGYYAFHGIYEPLAVLFRRTAPFQLHAISQRPYWITGRGNLTAATDAAKYRFTAPEDMPKGHTEFFYLTSISWKTHGQTYHGFIDDELFVSFGIEDARAGTIDVRAQDLLQDLAFCT